MKKLLACLFLAVSGFATAIIAPLPMLPERVTPWQRASLWGAAPGIVLGLVVLPCEYTTCFESEPSPHQHRVVRWTVIALNTCAWPGALGFVLGLIYGARRWAGSIKTLASRMAHSPTAVSFAVFAGLAAFFLARSLYGDQSTSVVRSFWPGVVCFLVAAGVLVFWVVTRLGAAKRAKHTGQNKSG